jgi:hypothetical protein
VVLRHQRETGHRHPDPRQVENRIRPGPGHHENTRTSNSPSKDTLPDGAIEIAIEDAKRLFGTGQARNRTARAVERTIPFMLACQAIAVTWYATAGHSPADTAA